MTLVANRCRALIQPVLTVSLLAALTGCFVEREQVERFSGPTMGSTYTVQFVATNSTPPVEQVQAMVEAYLAEVDQAFSTYREDSLLSRFNQLPAGSCMAMPESVRHVTATALQLAAQSDGAFEPTIKPLLRAWGFGPGSQGPKHPTADELAAAKARMGYQQLSMQGEQLCKAVALELDLNSIVAGYAIDQLGERLQAMGVERYLVEATGELKAQGLKPKAQPWRIAIEAPHDNERVAQQVVTLDGIGVSNSGDYRNYYEEDGVRLSHTLDPRTEKPIDHHLASVTVLHESTELADGLSTLLMVLGPVQGYSFAKAHQIAALFVTRTESGFTAQGSPLYQQRYAAQGVEK